MNGDPKDVDDRNNRMKRYKIEGSFKKKAEKKSVDITFKQCATNDHKMSVKYLKCNQNQEHANDKQHLIVDINMSK